MAWLYEGSDPAHELLVRGLQRFPPVRAGRDGEMERPTHPQADACADGILDRFYLRPATQGPHATCRRMMYEVGQELQRALGHRSLYLVSGRSAEVQAMEEAIARAYEALGELKRVLR